MEKPYYIRPCKSFTGFQSSILDYFNRNYSLKDVKYLPENFKLEDMKNVFGFEYVVQNYVVPGGYFNFMRDPTERVVDIKGYDYLFDMRTLNGGGTVSNAPLTASYNYETAVVKIK